MTFKEAITRRVHSVLCRPDLVPQADCGCCGCGAAEMDVYLTVGCDYCQAPGEGYCWACFDGDWPFWITPADFTVLPRRERAA